MHSVPLLLKVVTQKLKDGKIFMITYDKAEIFDPSTDKFYIAGKKSTYRLMHSLDKKGEKDNVKTTNNIYNRRTALALLSDGRVLLAGPNLDQTPNNAEIYNPKTNTFTNVGSQNYPMFYRDAVTLKDGRVLITGGTRVHYINSTNPNVKKSDKKVKWKPVYKNGKRINNQEVQEGNAEIFDPKTNKFTPIPPLNIGRAGHRSILLSNGNVLIVNGYRGFFCRTSENTKKAEIYNPDNNTFKTISATKRGRYSFSIQTLSKNKILLNSYNGWEIYTY